MRFTEKQLLGRNSQQAATIHRLLVDFFESEGLKQSDSDLFSADEDGWTIGYTVKIGREPKGRAEKLLSKLTANSGKIGWVGYEGTTQRATLSFWFYCDSRKTADKLENPVASYPPTK